MDLLKEKLKQLAKSIAELDKSAEESMNVNKAYVEPNSNYSLKDLAVGSKLYPSTVRTMIDLIVDQSAFLKKVKRIPVNAMMHEINIDNVNGKIVQVEEGVDPSSSDMASKNNAGYVVYLQSMQFFSQITFEQILSMSQIPNYEEDTRRELYIEFSNQLFRLAMFGTRLSSPDQTIKSGYLWNGTSYEGKPYTSVGGWLEFLRKGYSYNLNGVEKQVTTGGTVLTYQDGAFLNILDVLSKLNKSFPDKYRDPSVKILMSYEDYHDYKELVANNNASTDKLEMGNVTHYMGMEVMPLPMLVGYKTEVKNSSTGSEVSYYPGMIMMGRPQDFIIVEGINNATYADQLFPMKRVYQSVINIAMGFGAIPQRIAIAKKA